MKAKQFAVEAIMGFILWTVLLTPYMVLVMQTTMAQYVSWLIMQAVIVPWISVLVINVTNKVVKRLIQK